MGAPRGSLVPASDLGTACMYEQARAAYFNNFGMTAKANDCLALANNYWERLQDLTQQESES